MVFPLFPIRPEIILSHPTLTPPRRHRLRTLFLAGMVLCGAPDTAQATDGYFLNGVGAKGAGGVAIAQPEDALAIAANPASAIDIGHRLDIGAELFVPDRSATIHGNDVSLGETSVGLRF